MKICIKTYGDLQDRYYYRFPKKKYMLVYTYWFREFQETVHNEKDIIDFIGRCIHCLY